MCFSAVTVYIVTSWLNMWRKKTMSLMCDAKKKNPQLITENVGVEHADWVNSTKTQCFT